MRRKLRPALEVFSFKVVTGSHYLGGFIGQKAEQSKKRNQMLYDEEKLATILRPMTAEESGSICRGKETGA